ncbi:MAG: FAD-dependent oxidoreductase, partial [Rhodothermia bacterium]
MGYDYDAVVLGGGTAGLTAAGIAVNLGAKTALIEADRLGGDCTWAGSVPSNALIRAAAIAHTARSGANFGVISPDPVIEFDRVIGNVHRIREQIYRRTDSPDILQSMGIDVLEGRARFVDPHTLEVD